MVSLLGSRLKPGITLTVLEASDEHVNCKRDGHSGVALLPVGAPTEAGTRQQVEIGAHVLLQGVVPYKMCVQFHAGALYLEVGHNLLTAANVSSFTPDKVPRQTEVTVTFLGQNLDPSDSILLVPSSGAEGCPSQEDSPPVSSVVLPASGEC